LHHALYAPHTSAGRLPTERGLRLFVDGLLHFGERTEEERTSINAALGAALGAALEVGEGRAAGSASAAAVKAACGIAGFLAVYLTDIVGI
jgi:heat-inducible transcriptional repressor